MRGKVYSCLTSPATSGITPARAGKSELEFILPDTDEDHPRACGEKMSSPTLICMALGSPPRVRGKVAGVVAAIGGPGITPARAGKSLQRHLGEHQGRDHPRACGEKDRLVFPVCLDRGSPPRVRGKDETCRKIKSRPGITPARAGKRA